MENPTYTFSLLGKHEIGINKSLLLIKISLFCWFAGARTTEVFIHVYLKHQGLTITHLSMMITISVVFQFIVAIISGMFADRTGRVKPFHFIFTSVFIVTLMCFTIMPKMDECTSKTIIFNCTDEEIEVQDSCQILQDSFHKDSCSLIYGDNIYQHDQNKNCSFVSTFLQKDFIIEKSHLNRTSDFCVYKVNFKHFSSETISKCETQNCKSIQIACSDMNPPWNCLKNRSFWILFYGALVVLYNASRTNVYRFLDIITMDLTNQYNTDFGKQRVWSILGSSVGPLLAGYLSYNTALNGSDNRYAPVFICAAIFAALSIISMWKVSPRFHKPAPTVWKKSLKFVMNLEIILFLLLLIIVGISVNFIIIYGNWYLQDLGASALLLGVSAGIPALCGLPLLYASKWFFNKVGLRNFFVFSLLSYVFYSFSFSFLREPWLAIAFDLVNVLAYQLFWVSSIQYCDEVAPIELQATMKVLAGTLHFNIARLGATAIGGYIMNNFGGRVAYRVIGSLALGYAIVYGIYLTIERRHKQKNRVQLNNDEHEADL